MADRADLAGHLILVAEDDYFIASDFTRLLEEAGAKVLGPSSSEEHALEAIASNRPSCALLDIKLDSGRSFRVAKELHTLGVPFIFISGYDRTTVPNEFSNITLLQKPADEQRVLESVVQMCRANPG